MTPCTTNFMSTIIQKSYQYKLKFNKLDKSYYDLENLRRKYKIELSKG